MIDTLLLSRWQFAITTVYHFFFVPLTLGLSLWVAAVETAYVRTGNEVFKRMAKFWGKLFLINFAMGVATGIVQEFQFGMNWAEYSRFVGDIFGAPLAIEALLAFFLESTFLGIWVFGWDKLSPRLHLLCIWLVAIGSNLSAFWILVANSFMQHPVGYVLNNGRAEMNDFLALITNGHLWVQFPHVVLAGMATAAFFVLGISAYRLLHDSPRLEMFRRSFNYALVYAAAAALLVAVVGHAQGQYVVKTQPMKMAAAEALWESEDPAALSLFTIGDTRNRRDVFSIRVPYLLSFLSYNRFYGEVQGINDLQAQYEEEYGPGDYVPSVFIAYWSFRGMLTTGLLMIVLATYGLYRGIRRRGDPPQWYLRVLVWAIALPFLANSAGWLLSEMGRQPWVVFGLMKTADGSSLAVSTTEAWVSLIAFTLLYAVLIVADVYLLRKYAVEVVEGTDAEAPAAPSLLHA